MNLLNNLKVVFLGTPDFAIPSLMELLNVGINVPMIVTQSDKPSGRGHKLIESPIKQLALSRGIAVRQPIKIREDRELINELRFIEPDLIVTAAFGQIISEEVIQIPKWGIWNVHASLLPRWRGAAPINWAILEGDKETGITIMQTEKGLDSGPILSLQSIPIELNDNAATLTDKLSQIGAKLLLETIELKLADKIKPILQDENIVTYASKLNKLLSPIDWQTMSAKQICQRVKALNPWPGVTFKTVQGESIKLTNASLLDSPQDLPSASNNGEIIAIEKENILVKCSNGVLQMRKVQPPNKGEMKATDWYRGSRLGERVQFT